MQIKNSRRREPGTIHGTVPPAIQHLTTEILAEEGQYQVLARWDTPRVVKGVSFSLRLNVAAEDGSDRLVSSAGTPDNGVLECAWINTSGDTYDIYINIGQYAYWLIAQYDYTGNANVTLHSTPEYSSVQPGNSTSGQTYTLFNSLMKPTPEDVGALSVNGGRLNGPLGIGTDNALGGNSIVFGDNDTGIKQNGDGILDTFANSQHTVRVAPGEMQVLGAIRAGNAKRMTMTSSNNSVLNAQFHLWGDGNRPTVIELDDDQGWHLYSQRNTDGSIQFVVNGQVIPDNYGNFDARYLTSGNVYTKGESDNRYVQNIQRGAPVWPGKVDEYGPAEAPAGCFLTQARHDPTTAYGVTFVYRPLQMWVGNGWRTING